MFKCYVPKNYGKDAADVLEQARPIMEEYADDGLDLTVRQLYYYFVAHDLFPEERRWIQVGGKWRRDPDGSKNAFPNYKWFGGIISDGRRSGDIDWDIVRDRTRFVRENAHWGSPREILSACTNQFRADLWAAQPYSPQVWIEKDALVGVLERPCQKLDVPYMSCRGYMSDSAVWTIAQEMIKVVQVHRTPVIIHLGDHDPSGCHMSEDILARLELFGGNAIKDKIEVRRIALTMDQVDEYQPPPNYAKPTDSRTAAYIEDHDTDECWELDALEPRVMRDLVTDEIGTLIDTELWAAATKVQTDGREALRVISKNFDVATDAAKEAEADDCDDGHQSNYE